MRLTPAAARKLRAFLTDVEHMDWPGRSQEAVALLRLLPKAAPRKAVPTQREAKAARRAVARLTTAGVRMAVWKRSNGMCESGCGTGLTEAGGELDHFIGGGRRRTMTTLENCWRLCSECHRRKTAYRPSAERWRNQFAAHCAGYGYPLPWEAP